MKLSRKVAVIMLPAALPLSLCVISVLPAHNPPAPASQALYAPGCAAAR